MCKRCMSYKTYDNIIITPYTIRRGLRRPDKACKIMAGSALYDGKGTILLHTAYIGKKDKVDFISLEEIITHETIHHIVADIVGTQASDDLDTMWQERTFINSNRIYIQRNKVKLI